MATIVFLTAEHVAEIHRYVVLRTGTTAETPPDDGGSEVFRNRDALDSAVHRLKFATQFGGEVDFARLAVLLVIGISQNQPFVDGNKRAAMASAVAFLDLNGRSFVGDPMEFARWLERVAEVPRGAEREAEETRFEDWLRPLIEP